MILSGFHAVASRLKQAGDSVRELYVDAQRADARMRELLALADRAGVRPHRVDSQRLDRLAGGRRHQGVVAIVEARTPAATDLQTLLDSLTHPPLLLLLDGVTDPRNLGACLRVADGAGVDAVVAPKDHACALTDVAMHTASGAAETVPYLMVTNLARTIDALQERDVFVVGAADDAPQSLYQLELPAAVAWALGAEGRGLRRLVRERCDALAHVPMAGRVESLNVSVAAGVVLYETVRQTRLRPSPP